MVETSFPPPPFSKHGPTGMAKALVQARTETGTQTVERAR